MKSATGARDWLCNPDSQVSAHYVLSPQGHVWQLVQEDQRAWHAGAGRWGACDDVNSHSIGIELCNTEQTPFSAPLMDALEILLSGIVSKWNITPERVIAHSCLAPGRKIDPGARFDWSRLARSGLAIELPQLTRTPDMARADALLQQSGYTAEVPFETRLQAFRLRHNPQVSGQLSPSDMGKIVRLAGDYPVDPSIRFA